MSEPVVRYADVPGFPGYRVGDDGSVWTCRRHGGNGNWERLSAKPGSVGYPKVSLSRDGKPHHFNTHRLVLLAFCGPPSKGQVGRHLNGVPTDCRLSNLAWGSRHENEADKVRHGTKLEGEACPNAVLTDLDVLELRRAFAAYEHIPTVMARLGKSWVAVGPIYSAIRGKTYKHLPGAIRGRRDRHVHASHVVGGVNWANVACSNGISISTFNERMQRGWSAENAATIPLQRRKAPSLAHLEGGHA